MTYSILYYALILWGLVAFHVPQLWMVYFLHFTKAGSGGIYNMVINVLLFFFWGLIHSLLARNMVKTTIEKLLGKGFIYIIIGTYLEDRDTIKELGEDYVKYSQNVPMLLPRLSPWKP